MASSTAPRVGREASTPCVRRSPATRAGRRRPRQPGPGRRRLGLVRDGVGLEAAPARSAGCSGSDSACGGPSGSSPEPRTDWWIVTRADEDHLVLAPRTGSVGKAGSAIASLVAAAARAGGRFPAEGPTRPRLLAGAVAGALGGVPDHGPGPGSPRPCRVISRACREACRITWRTSQSGGLTVAPAILWFRRDLRLDDLPALRGGWRRRRRRRAVVRGRPGAARAAGPNRRRFLAAALRALDRRAGGRPGAAPWRPAPGGPGSGSGSRCLGGGSYGRLRSLRRANVTAPWPRPWRPPAVVC